MYETKIKNSIEKGANENIPTNPNKRGINTDSKFIYNKGPKGSNEIDKYEYY